MSLIPITDEDGLDDALSRKVAVLYKHSPRCGVSTVARRELERFQRENPDTPVFIVDVVASRPLSRRIAERLGVRHESPQAIVVKCGKPEWNTSQMGITSAAIAQSTRDR